MHHICHPSPVPTLLLLFGLFSLAFHIYYYCTFCFNFCVLSPPSPPVLVFRGEGNEIIQLSSLDGTFMRVPIGKELCSGDDHLVNVAAQ